MTQPWLKIYPERMRGDAALAQLTDAEQMWLIHCWHIAANQEDDTHYGHLRLPNGAPYDYKSLAAVLRRPPKKVNEFMLKLVALRIAIVDDDSDYTLTFPNLRTWQRKDDTTRAERQKRFRNAHRNAQSNAPNNAPSEDRDQKTDISKVSIRSVRPSTPGSDHQIDEGVARVIDRLLLLPKVDKGSRKVLEDLARQPGVTEAVFADGYEAAYVKGAGVMYAVRTIQNSLKGAA